MGNERPAPFLPRPEHVAYLANLLVVLAVLYGAYYVYRDGRRARRGILPALDPRPLGPTPDSTAAVADYFGSTGWGQ